MILYIYFTVPSPVVMVSEMDSVLVSGSHLSLTCSIQPSTVTTPSTVISNWTTPNSTYDTVNPVNDTSVELMISSVVTADSGEYICSATIADSSGSIFVLNSEPATDTINVTIS